MEFSMAQRQQYIEKMSTEQLDLLIIGGGITGAGVALQASASGLKTGLIEMQDFAEGTSSRSTKLVHGGIRYLKTFDVGVVADTVQERAVVQQIAPHIPKPDPMLLPVYDEPGVTFDMFSLKVAMDLYDRLADVTDSRYTNYLLTKEEVLERQPFLRKENLLGGGVYLDFRNNDARLVIENIKQAAEDGGYMVSRAKAVGFIYDDSKQIVGVTAEDVLTGKTFDIRARVVINTAGPWVDDVRALDKTHELVPQIRPTKGVHLVVDRSKLPVPQPTYVDTGKNDGRMIFAIPRENKTYFGTTDTDYTGDYKHPTVTKEDVDYLLSVINYRFPDADITLSDIEASWAGLRPLIASGGDSDYNGGQSVRITDESFDAVVNIVGSYLKKDASRTEVETVLKNVKQSAGDSTSAPSSISRGSHLERETDGLVTLSGGKITDYRKMAEGAMALIVKLLAEEHDRRFTAVDSKTYAVSGGKFDASAVSEALLSYTQQGVDKGLSEADAAYLAELYGSNTPKVLSLLETADMVPGLSIADSLSLLYAMRYEMTLTPVDFLLRRTNHLLFMRDTLDDLIQPVLDGMANYYQWSPEEKDEQLAVLKQVIAESDLASLKAQS